VARINIEDSLFTDPYFMHLCALLKSDIKAIGYFVKIARLAQSFWKNGKQLIPKSIYEYQKFPSAITESKMVVLKENGYYLHGSEKNFAWIFSKRENGKLGGRPAKVIENKGISKTETITETEPTNNPLYSLLFTHNSIKEKESMSSSHSTTENSKKILEYLNSKTNKNFRFVETNIKLVKSILQIASIEEIKQVIDNRVSAWMSDAKMHEYLRPSTLFRKVNFESYLAESTKNGVQNANSKISGEERIKRFEALSKATIA